MKVRLRIKEVATERGVSMTKLSQRSEIAYNTIRKIYRDPYKEVSLSTLVRIANVLKVSIHDLIEEVSDDAERV